jgi:2-iminobutanoate/2-iminopropanoate deaminase
MNPEYLNPAGTGMSISPAVRFGNLVFTSGASIYEPGDTIEVQTAKTIDYLADILNHAGTDLQHVIKASVFLAHIEHWNSFNETWKRYFPTNKPARTTTEVGKFGSEDMLIEVDFVAALP